MNLYKSTTIQKDRKLETKRKKALEDKLIKTIPKYRGNTTFTAQEATLKVLR